MAKRKNGPMAPYFVQLRDYERELLKSALEAADGELAQAASMLGVTSGYIKARARLLGGVRPNEPKHEPPGPAAKAWNATAPSGRRYRKPGRDANEETSTDTETATAPLAGTTETEPTN
jgi:hypothetical protein